MSAIAGTFSDIKTIKSRSVVQLCIEVPIERADEALSILGGVPQPGKERWVGIAPIPEQNQERPALPAEVATAGVHPAPDAVTPGGRSPAGAEQARPRERKLSELAWWFVNKDKAFQTWMMRAAGLKQWPANAMREADTDTWLKEALGIISKSELDTDEAAARAFTALIEKFEVSVGRIRDPAA